MGFLFYESSMGSEPGGPNACVRKSGQFVVPMSCSFCPTNTTPRYSDAKVTRMSKRRTSTAWLLRASGSRTPLRRAQSVRQAGCHGFPGSTGITTDTTGSPDRIPEACRLSSGTSGKRGIERPPSGRFTVPNTGSKTTRTVSMRRARPVLEGGAQSTPIIWRNGACPSLRTTQV